MASPVDSIAAAEVASLKQKYGSDCRHISNIGDFSHVVSVTFSQWGIKLKFQLTDAYPSVPADVIVSCEADGSRSLTDDLLEHLKIFKENNEDSIKSFPSLIEEAHNWLETTAGNTMSVSISNSSRSEKQKKKKRNPKAKMEKCDEINEKKPSMKTAEDVIKRILWDDQLHQEDFVIGYVDRFEGLMEKGFTTFSWEDIASVDDFTALAIPKHRIQYFKYRSVIVWDKTLRLDNVFGSTGSGIIITDVQKDLDASNPQICGSNEIAIASRLHGDDSSEDNSDDSDVEVSVNISSKLPTSDVGKLRSITSKMVIRPNYFVCQRITSPNVVAKVADIQASAATIEPRIAQCFVAPSRLHLTLCTLKLNSEAQVTKACEVLDGARSILTDLARQEISIRINGVDHFYGRVVHAKIEPNPALEQFVSVLRKVLTDAGLEIADSYDYVPHVTLMKLMKAMDSSFGSSQLPPWAYRNFSDVDFGTANISAIDLCSMNTKPDSADFYATPLHVDLLNDV